MNPNPNSKCPSCKSENLLHGKMEAVFHIPNAKFRFTVIDTPTFIIPGDATACLDCGTIWSKVDPTMLRKHAARWMEDDAKKSLDLG